MSEYQRPSKQFLIRGAIAVGILAVILIVQTNWFRKLIHKKPLPSALTPTTVGEIIGKDTNGNGIPDWEEKLWGLDPTVLYTNGVPNKQIIEEKKKALGVQNNTSDENLNSTDKLARQLFTISAALGDSSQVDDQTLQDIAGKLGASINIDQINNHYSLKDIRTTKTTTQSLQAYYSAFQKAVAKHESDGQDIPIIVNALETGDTSQLSELSAIATSYKQFTKELNVLQVPIGLAPYHLNFINGLYGVAESFSYIQQLNDDAAAGVVGIAIYKNYSAKLFLAMSDIEEYLRTYGILGQ